MRVERLPPDLARRITPSALRRHVEAHGWQQVPGVNGRIAVYAPPSNPLHQVIVPLDEHLRDYTDRVSEAVAGLAEFEGRTVSDLVGQLLLPPADLLQLREAGPDLDPESLSLDHAARLLAGVKRALLSAAHSVLSPQPFYTRLEKAEPERFVSRCRFGHTRRGSFVLTLACPLDLDIGLFGPNDTPFARRVTTALVGSLHDLSQATEVGDLTPLTDRGRHPGLSANLCEAVALLRPDHPQAVVDLSAVWSVALPAGPTITSGPVRLTPAVFDAAEQLAPRLRAAAPRRVARFYGYVDALSGQPTADDLRPAGDVEVSLFEPDGERVVKARLDLLADAYAVAGAAHLANELVTFRGVLRPLPRISVVEQVSGFSIVEPAEEARADVAASS